MSPAGKEALYNPVVNTLNRITSPILYQEASGRRGTLPGIDNIRSTTTDNRLVSAAVYIWMLWGLRIPSEAMVAHRAAL